MVTTKLDITGKVCPYCLLAVQKAEKAMNKADLLIITCDHPPAATVSIPQYAIDKGLEIQSRKISPGLWEIQLLKK